MKVKVSELEGAALDWAVGKCQPLPDHGQRFVEDGYHPSTDWAQGGPIIEREGMGVWMYQWNERGDPEVGWYAETKEGNYVRTGSTPLIAAMRCYVASKLGKEVDVPDNLGEQA